MNDDPFPFGPLNDGDNCFPKPNPFGEPEPYVPYIQTYPVAQPSTLELAKALRDCFKETNGRVPTGPLDTLIEQYENPMFTITVPPVEEDKPLDTLKMGTAGAAIEREAHTRTLDLLRRARDLLKRGPQSSMVEGLLADICEQCPVLNDDSEPHEETGFGD